MESCRTTPDDARVTKVLEWLESLYDKREQWAARWTWDHLTLGVDSTQRAEAVHSAVALFLKANMPLTKLYTLLAHYVEDSQNSAEAKSERLLFAQGTSARVTRKTTSAIAAICVLTYLPVLSTQPSDGPPCRPSWRRRVRVCHRTR